MTEGSEGGHSKIGALKWPKCVGKLRSRYRASPVEKCSAWSWAARATLEE